jgi:hypothetical protein
MSIGVILLIAFGVLLVIGGPIIAERASKAASKAQQPDADTKGGDKTAVKK